MKIGWIVALAAAAVLCMGSTAVAGDIEVTLKFDQGSAPGTVKYKGKVTGDKDCVGGRRIKIIHDGEVIAETETDENGKYSVEGPEPPDGDKVKVKVLKEEGCKGTSHSEEYGD
jgi:hypothetical protein